MSAELRNQLRLAIAFWVLHPQLNIVKEAIDKMLNAGVNEQSLVDSALQLENIYPPDAPSVIQILINNLHLTPLNLMDPSVAARIVAHEELRIMLEENNPTKFWELYERLAFQTINLCEEHGDEYLEFKYSLYQIDSHLFDTNKDGSRFILSKPQFGIFKKQSTTSALAEAKQIAAELIKSIPDEIKDPA